MIKAMVFDLDGTLLDTIEDLADSVNHALQSHGLPVLDYSIYKKNVGNGAFNLCKASLQSSLAKIPSLSSSPVTVEEILTAFKTHYRGNMNHKTKPYPGILGGLSRLQAHGILLAVISNKPDPNTKDLVARYFPDIHFQFVIGDSDAFPKKPDPSSLRFIMKKWGVTPGQTLLIGDGETDIQTAMAAKVSPLGVLWGFRTEEELRSAGAVRFLKDPSEIGLSLIGQVDYDK